MLRATVRMRVGLVLAVLGIVGTRRHLPGPPQRPRRAVTPLAARPLPHEA